MSTPPRNPARSGQDSEDSNKNAARGKQEPASTPGSNKMEKEEPAGGGDRSGMLGEGSYTS